MKTILVVEDNPDNMALIDQILTDEGFIVLKAVMAEEGLEFLKNHHIDLVLMDISLPKMSGTDAIRAIKSDEVLKSIPVIAVSAHAYTSDKEKVFKAGCDAYITKPLSEDVLLMAIKKLLKK
jgi:two-component system cell cycle response regulator DivK